MHYGTFAYRSYMLQFVLGIKNRRRRIVSIDVVRLARAHAHTHASTSAGTRRIEELH